MYENLVKTIINDYNGIIKPLIIDSKLTNGTGITNSSLLVEDDKIHLIMRHVEYTLYHCEDARLVKWSDKYYLCGVRRDTTTNGQGRMELSEIIIGDKVEEINRNRIEVPDINSYCEKNWMPIIDEPFHFVKWTNPTEIVKVNLEKNNCEQIYLNKKYYDLPFDIRGGSPLIEWENNSYICITHEVDFTLKNQNGFKNADYYHRFVIFNKDYNIEYISDNFNFMTAKIEFCIGLSQYKNDILISFGFQDNCSYLIRINKERLKDLIYDKLKDNKI